MPQDFVKDVIEAFSKIKEEIDEKRGELDFRHSLASHFLKNVLGWGRKKGEGHFEIREREDIRLFDDNNRCVVIIETKNPKLKLAEPHILELKKHLEDYIGVVQYGALTNGHEFKLFEYTGEGELNELTSIDIDTFVQRGAESLSRSEREKIHLLRRLRKDHFVGIVEPEYFKKTVREIKVEDPKNFGMFIEDLRTSLNELTEIMERFFRFYNKAGENHYGGKFLKDEAFPMWKGTSVGKEEELIEKFCRETAYVFLNRILFTRILEDKGIVQRMISGKEFAQSLLMFGESAYEMVLKQAYKNVERFYEHFYEFGIFDWWRLPEEKRGMLSDEDMKVQNELEKDLNSVVLRDVLKLLNRYDFRNVGRDLLGDVYQEYLPPAERKRLGEFYTPVEVVRYILDAVGYVPENRIENKLLLDPACGSGTFLVEAAKRLIKRYQEKLKNPLLPDNAKVIIEGIVNNIHGLDINPFACHIAEMNMLFNIIDFLNAVHRRYKDYRLPRFNICCTDSLMPPEKETTKISEFVTNGRIRTHLEEAKRAATIKKKQFDFVVGNPPYVRTHLIKEKKIYQQSYSDLTIGQYDISYLFVGRGLEWLKQDGKLGYITSNKFCVLESGIGLRKRILNTAQIEKFIDFSGVQTFTASLPAAAIITLHKAPSVNKKLIQADIKTQSEVPPNVKGEGLELLEKTLAHLLKHLNFYAVNQERFRENDELLFDLSLPDELVPIVRKIEKKSKKLIPDVVTDIKRGLRPDTSKFKDKFFISQEEFEKLSEPEKKSYKKHIRGEDIVAKYRIKWAGEYVKFDTSKMAEGGNKTLYENPKIVIKEIGRRLRAAYDRDQYYCYKTIHIIREPDSKVDLKYLVGVLNSTLIEFFFKSEFYLGRLGRGSFRFREQFLKYLPIKLPQTPKEKQLAAQISQKVDFIVEQNKKLDELERKIKEFPSSYSSKFEKLVNVAEKCELSKEKYNTKLLTLEPIKKARKELYKLTLTKEDHMLFSSKAVAECVFEQLKRKSKVRRNEIYDLKVPSEKDAAKIMEEFSKDKKRANEIEKEVEKLEREIDKLVYKLYGLDTENREVIEGFLKKF